MFYVYILQSEKDKKTYTGFCKNIVTRLNKHNSGQVKVTKHRCPFWLIYHEEVSTLAEAKKREKYWKSGGGRRKLSRFFKEGFPPR
ncbi:MAG: GIY-YIG nuclease family protein [Planctomycetes bacterium]|nr:GIY-YIG nuclease family protein [Planctomycetota bacterium]